MKIMKKKRRPKILIILMYSRRALNSINICKANFKKSIRNARLIFRNWYDEQGIAKLLNNLRDKLDAIIVSGSDYRITDRSSPKVPEIIFKHANKIHILALCYGMQYIPVRFGKFSNVRARDAGYIRSYDRYLKIKYPFDIVKTRYRYIHNDIVIKVGKNIEAVIKRKNMIDMLYHKKRDILGLQFHPEHYVKSGKLFYNAWLSWLSHRK
jgi:GMP synthase-like glutamine amidotransferase